MTTKTETRWEEHQRVFFLHALALNGFNRSATGKYLGLSYRTVRNIITKYRSMGYKVPSNPRYRDTFPIAGDK